MQHSSPAASFAPSASSARPSRSTRRASALALALACATALPASGCAEFQHYSSELSSLGAFGGGQSGSLAAPVPPRVTVTGVRLAQAPSNQLLATYYCSQVAPAPVCGLLGPMPTSDQLRFVFDVDLSVRNDNAFPLPVVEMLSAFTAYPSGSGEQHLGAVCLSLCEDGASCPQDNPNACRSDSHDVRTIDDFARAAGSFLVAVADGQERFDNLRVRTVGPNGETHATVRLALAPEVAVSVIRTMSGDAINQIEQGRVPQFTVPYQFEGTVWVNVEHFGRIAAAIPAYRGTWTLQ
jgi:hypothetical protein